MADFGESYGKERTPQEEKLKKMAVVIAPKLSWMLGVSSLRI